MRNERADVVIVGCRPAGASPAITLAQHGESMIVDAGGSVLARLGPEDYDAIACAEVEIGHNPPVVPSELISTDLVDEPVEGTMTAKVDGSDAV
jgi:flavin-dependent dehydrogenase